MKPEDLNSKPKLGTETVPETVQMRETSPLTDRLSISF